MSTTPTTIDQLIEELQRLKDEHGGDTKVLVGASSTGWKLEGLVVFRPASNHCSSFVEIRQRDYEEEGGSLPVFFSQKK